MATIRAALTAVWAELITALVLVTGAEFKYFTLKEASDLFNTHEVQLTILIITVISYVFNRIGDD